jgi:hypothetical protein
LSTTIQHVIGVRNGTDDKTILAGAATDSMILSIFVYILILFTYLFNIYYIFSLQMKRHQNQEAKHYAI